MMSITTIIILITALIYVSTLEVPFNVNTIFQSNMILQKGPSKSTVYGQGPINSEVTLKLDDKIYKTTIDINGKWKIFMDPQPASFNKRTITIENNKDTNIIKLNDVIFGDIYLCSGQSNMEFVVKDGFNSTDTFEESKLIGDKIRIITIERNYQPDNVTDKLLLRTNWSFVSPESLGANLTVGYYYFSAICYYYGLKLYKSLNIPIGLIANSWSGTTIEVWTPYEELYSTCTDFVTIDKIPNNKHSSLFNGMIYPLLSFTIKGAIWYQGESNAANPGQYSRNKGYECIFPTMIDSWRKYFSENSGTDPNFPFGFVQLPGYCASTNHLCKPGPNNYSLRWAQTISYGYVPNKILNNTFYAVTIDLPDPIKPASSLGDVHPRYKIDVGNRLGHAALGFIYKSHNYSLSGPIIKNCFIVRNSIVINIKPESIQNERILLKNDIGFEVLDIDNKWITVPVISINDYSIELDISEITAPNSIRYLWKSNPCCPDAYGTDTDFTCPHNVCGIYTNQSDLPLYPFYYMINQGMCVINE